MKAILLLGAPHWHSRSRIIASAQNGPGNGQFNGNGYWHTNGPTSTGQPGADCEEVITEVGRS